MRSVIQLRACWLYACGCVYGAPCAVRVLCEGREVVFAVCLTRMCGHVVLCLLCMRVAAWADL